MSGDHLGRIGRDPMFLFEVVRIRGCPPPGRAGTTVRAAPLDPHDIEAAVRPNAQLVSSMERVTRMVQRCSGYWLIDEDGPCHVATNAVTAIRSDAHAMKMASEQSPRTFMLEIDCAGTPVVRDRFEEEIQCLVEQVEHIAWPSAMSCGRSVFHSGRGTVRLFRVAGRAVHGMPCDSGGRSWVLRCS